MKEERSNAHLHIIGDPDEIADLQASRLRLVVAQLDEPAARERNRIAHRCRSVHEGWRANGKYM
jgi:RNase P protein component